MTARTGGRRIVAIDAARGFAMLAVCTSHVGDVISAGHLVLAQFMMYLGLVATPAFLLLSGVSAGYVLRPDATPLTRIKLIDRGLFLLLVGHALLALIHAAEHGFGDTYRSLYITDAVAVALFCAAAIRAWSPRALLATGLLAVVAGWILPWVWHPGSYWVGALDRILFYSDRPDGFPLGYTVPIATYLGVFLVGMSISRHWRKVIQGVDVLNATRKAAWVLLAIIAVVLGVKAASVLLVKPGLSPEAYAMLWHFVDPREKLPPGMAYVLLFGALAALVFCLLLRLDVQGRAPRLLEALATIGRASLMAYLFQEFVIYALTYALGVRHLTSIAFWVVYLAGTVALMWLACRAWGRINGNRYLTIGLRRTFESARVSEAARCRETG